MVFLSELSIRGVDQQLRRGARPLQRHRRRESRGGCREWSGLCEDDNDKIEVTAVDILMIEEYAGARSGCLAS